ncbi:MAG: hypothetical protein QOG87_2120, partial [Actinomycetota bacterium]
YDVLCSDFVLFTQASLPGARTADTAEPATVESDEAAEDGA